MVDFALALPEEVCQEIGRRARTRRLSLGRCTLETFVRILEVLNALPDLASVLVTQASSIDDMRQNVVTRTRKRAYTRARKASP
jgi:hypothetical protein